MPHHSTSTYLAKRIAIRLAQSAVVQYSPDPESFERGTKQHFNTHSLEYKGEGSWKIQPPDPRAPWAAASGGLQDSIYHAQVEVCFENHRRGFQTALFRVTQLARQFVMVEVDTTSGGGQLQLLFENQTDDSKTKQFYELLKTKLESIDPQQVIYDINFSSQQDQIENQAWEVKNE